MISKTRRGRSQDRKRVAGDQDYEVRYETKKIGEGEGAVKRAVKRAGPSRRKVRRRSGHRAARMADDRQRESVTLGHTRSHRLPGPPDLL